MTRVGNSEQVMALVRNQLQRMARRSPSDKTRKTEKAEPRVLNRRERVQALNAIRDLTDDEFAEGLVRAMLTEELGDAVSSSPEFQAVVEKTARTMRSDPEVAALLREVRQSM